MTPSFEVGDRIKRPDGWLTHTVRRVIPEGVVTDGGVADGTGFIPEAALRHYSKVEPAQPEPELQIQVGQVYANDKIENNDRIGLMRITRIDGERVEYDYWSPYDLMWGPSGANVEWFRSFRPRLATPEEVTGANRLHHARVLANTKFKVGDKVQAPWMAGIYKHCHVEINEIKVIDGKVSYRGIFHTEYTAPDDSWRSSWYSEGDLTLYTPPVRREGVVDVGIYQDGTVRSNGCVSAANPLTRGPHRRDGSQSGYRIRITDDGIHEPTATIIKYERSTVPGE